MRTRLVSNDDARLEKISDFEIQTIDDTGEIVKCDWYIETTFNKVVEMLSKNHKGGLEISIFDNEGELHSILKTKSKDDNESYVVLPC